MDDVVVTFAKKPKKGWAIPSLKEYKTNPSNVDQFVFKIGNKPKYANPGDKCYIGFNNKIQGYFIIEEIRHASKKEAKDFEGTDRNEGNYLFCDYYSFKELKDKPFYKRGWRSFRYYKNLKK